MFYQLHESGKISVHNAVHTSSGSFDESNREDVPEPFHWFDTNEEAYLYFASLESTPLDQARAGMSALLADLPVESRAMFAGTRAAIEKLLDLNDVEAAHKLLTDTTTTTEEESNVKSIILAALLGFMP